MKSSPHIIVLGAGFAGVSFARHYRGPGKITIIDKENHHLFQPLLYQVATAALAATEVATPIRSIFKNQKNVSVVMDRVTEIDCDARTLKTVRDSFSFDYLIVAVGGCTSYFGNDGWEEHAPGLKSLADAIKVRTQMLENFELAETSKTDEEKARLMRTVIIGGGPTGVEMAGAMADLTRKIFSKDFRNIQPQHSQIILIDGADRVLTPYTPHLSESARKQLETLGVEVRLRTMVTKIEAGCVHLKEGENEYSIEAGTIVWGGGVQANPLVASLPCEKDRAGRLLVQPDLSLSGHSNIFALGDLVSLKDGKQKPVPGVAPAAMQMGKYVAEVLERELTQQAKSEAAAARAPFVYWDKGSLATIGRSKAVAQFGKLQLDGFLAWIGWLFIHLLFLVGFRNKVITLIQWIYQYVTFRTGARIIPSSKSKAGPMQVQVSEASK